MKKSMFWTAAAVAVAVACFVQVGIKNKPVGLGLSAKRSTITQKVYGGAGGVSNVAESHAAMSASKENPFVNTLGMKFVPVPVANLLFCIWETRVQDYEVFVKATQREWIAADFKQEPSHPVVNVNLYEAISFCEWLTEKERREGWINAHQVYRLPTDLEWSAAVGLPKEPGSTPEERSGKIRDVYPWAEEWPPPPWAGNYGFGDDGFPQTAPVGSFRPNKFGIYDMGGNAREWCQDWYDADHSYYVLRDASWADHDAVSLLSSYRIETSTGSRNDTGFRVVLGRH